MRGASFLFLIFTPFFFATSVFAKLHTVTTPQVVTLLLQPGVVAVEAFVPETYESLPKKAKYGRLSKEGYSRCADKIAKHSRSFYRIKYKSGPYLVEGFVSFPKEFSASKKYPYVIYNRGGNRDFAKLQACGLLVMSDLFRNEPYVLFASQFRGTSGSEGKDEYGGAEVEDVLALNSIARSYAFVDQSKAYSVGWSRGAMMTFLAVKKGAQFNAIAVLGGLPDLSAVDASRSDMKEVFNELIPNIRTRRNAELEARSVNRWPELLTSPLLLLHGKQDEKAPIGPVQELDRKLNALKRPHKLVVYDDSGHFFESQREMLATEILDWFRIYEGGAPSPPQHK